MKQNDILRLFCKSHPEIQRDIDIALKLIKTNKIEHAGEKYRDAARVMLSNNLLSFSIDYYTYASDLFIKCGNYQKAINTELTVYNIHKLNNDVLEMANSQEKIASYYKHYLKDNNNAGIHYFSAAKFHEKNQNYISAFKKARFASECFEEGQNSMKKIMSNSLASRMALQAGYYEKAGEHAIKWHQNLKKDYSHHYISVCVKGFKSFSNTTRYAESLMFVNEIIDAHFTAKMPQENIINYLVDGQKLFLQVNKAINYDYNKKMLSLLQDNYSKIANYSLELRQHADSIGLSDISDFYYLQQQDSRMKVYKESKKLPKYLSYKIWRISCLYGTSLGRWLAFSLLLIILFGLIFSDFPCPAFLPDFIKDILFAIHPDIKVASINNNFTPFYYSIVTFTTLGYGDITPGNLAAQVFSVIEVFTGYIMLGGLLTVFSKKIVH